MIEKTNPPFLFQVDLATDRDARDRMTTASGGVAILPQLHVGGKVREVWGGEREFCHRQDFSSL